MTAVAAGQYHSLALKSDGTVWAWGRGVDGQLGDGATVQRNSPVQVTGLGNVAQLWAGGFVSAARKSDNTWWIWGDNSRGQLLDGTTTNRSSPIPLTLPGTPTALAFGETHVLALRSDGTVLAWGANDFGQLGDGTTTARSSPITVQGLSGVIAITAGQFHSIALKSDGTVWAWGNNGFGRLGTTGGDSRVPQQTSIGPTVAIAAGFQHSMAITADGIAWYWGNFAAPLPNTANSPKADDVFLRLAGSDTRPLPFAFLPTFGVAPSTWVSSNGVVVSGLGADAASPVSVSGGEYSVNNSQFTTLSGVVTNGDTVIVRQRSSESFAATTMAVLSIGGTGGESAIHFVRTRTDVSASRVRPQVAAGDSHSLLLSPDGTVFGTGYNSNGQLGNGTIVGLSTLRPVSGLSGVSFIATGAFHSLALRSDGTVAAWGANTYGQLGHGSVNPAERNFVSVVGLASASSLGAGKYHSIALAQNGSVWAWGLNSEGQVGDGSGVATRSTPVAVSGITSAIAIAAGGRHNLALLVNGTVMAWGAK